MEAIESYVSQTISHPLLTAEEELDTAKAIRKAHFKKKRAEAREKLINSNLRIVIKMAYSFNRFCKMPLMDLIGAGNEGLVKAVDNFNPEGYQTKFSTFAFSLIRQSISKAIMREDRAVYVPSHILAKGKQYKALKEIEDITDEEIMEELNVSVKVLSKIKMAKVQDISLDQEKYVDDCGVSTTYKDVIADPKAVSAEKLTYNAERDEALEKGISKLNPLEQDIIRAIFFKDKKLREVAIKHGVSPEAIRQRKEKALKKLRWTMKDYR